MRTEAQRERIRICCDRLYRKLEQKSCIIDDESYFTSSHSSINGNDNFYSSDIAQTPASVKYRPTSKFEQKILFLLCSSKKGASKPYFISSGFAVNQYIYKKEFIKKRLVPFIEEHHSDDQYILWPEFNFLQNEAIIMSI